METHTLSGRVMVTVSIVVIGAIFADSDGRRELSAMCVGGMERWKRGEY